MARKRKATSSNLSGEGEKDNSVSPPRRTLRNRQTATVKDGNNEDGSDQSESCESIETDHGSDEEMPKKSEMRTRHQRACARTNKPNEIENDEADQSFGSESPSSIDDGDVGSDDDYDEQDTRDAHGEINDKPKARPNQTKQSLDGRGKKRKIEKPTSLKCPHCSKNLSSALGLKYHLDKFVCRPELAPDGGKAKRKRGRSVPAKGNSNKGRSRVSKEDRTCKNCKRVFTSTLGLDYHVKHKVCFQSGGQNLNGIALPLLSPGDRFVTSFGIVEVLRDDRGTPVSTSLRDIKTARLQWTTAKSRQEQQLLNSFAFVAGGLRLRRERIHSVLEKEKPTASSVFQAYFGGHPNAVEIPVSVWPKLKPLGPDPAAPEESCPDRIVECRLVSDQRIRYDGLEDKIGSRLQSEEDGSPSSTSAKLYLRRALLTESYDPAMVAIICQTCGRTFSSAPGARYHINNSVCSRKSATSFDYRAQLAKLVEKRKEQSKPRKPEKRRRVRPPRKKETAIYPEVLISLGFELVKHDVVLPEVAGDNHENPCDLTVDPPDALLEHLKTQLAGQQRQADDQKYGALYAEVFKSLGFKIPKKKKKRAGTDSAPAVETKPKRRRRNPRKVKPPPPPKPSPPIVDTRTLVDEVDSGRYPSIKRNQGDDHDDQCFICKEHGELICCDFCTKVVHWTCIQQKFTLKPPEPEDDFMCHRCIQYILHRRNRAEKRRLQKQAKTEQEHQAKGAQDQEVQAPAQGEQPTEIEEGMEYSHLAAKGQETSELIELLQDARLRLLQSIETTKINNVRRRILEL